MEARKREIGARVRARREKAERSVDWLAERLGVNRRTILNIEAGISSLTLEDAEIVADALDCRVSDISSVGAKLNGKKARASA